MSPDPLVSVIMPAYNVERYIAESIDSVLAQTFENWELIIVDDGSTDCTADLVKPFLQDLRIRYFHQHNAGPGQARNTAMANAQGEYVAFLDSDDLWLPMKLSYSVDLIQKHNCDLIITDCYIFEDGEPFSKETAVPLGIEEADYFEKEGVLLFLERNRIPNLTVLAKKAAILQAGKFADYRAAEDYDLWLRMLCNGAHFHSDSKCLSAYRMREDSITAADRVALFETMLVKKNFLKQYPEYKTVILSKLRYDFKYWLYNGAQAAPKTYRQLIPELYPLLYQAILYPLSFLLPFKYLRKVTNHLV